MVSLEQHEMKIQSNKERLDSQSTKLDKIDKCLSRLTTIVEHQEQAENDHEERIRAIEQKGGASFDRLVWAVLGAFITGIVVFLLTSVGLK